VGTVASPRSDPVGLIIPRGKGQEGIPSAVTERHAAFKHASIAAKGF
jgi:hypothetical protein